MNKYVSKDTLENIYNRNENVYGIVSNPNILNENNRCFGKVILLINLKSQKKIVINDIIEFRGDKIKWRSTKCDDNGCVLCLVDPYWCRLYIYNPKIQCKVRVLKSHVTNNGRIYYGENEFINMTKDEFIKRQLLLKFAKWPYIVFAAVENFNRRYWETKDYYKSLNETSKHYIIKHQDLKSYRADYSKAVQEFNNKWNKLLLDSYRNEKSNNEIEFLFNKYKEKSKNKKGKVINLRTIP